MRRAPGRALDGELAGLQDGAPEGLATSCSSRATAALYGGKFVRSAVGSPRRRRRGPEGLRSAGGARRVTVPVTATWWRTVRRPAAGSVLRAWRFHDRWPAPARRAPRALETVEKILTDATGVKYARAVGCASACNSRVFEVYKAL